MMDTLNLDQRQRAMLAEMGVRVWMPPSQAARMPASESPTWAAQAAATPFPPEAVQARAELAPSLGSANANTLSQGALATGYEYVARDVPSATTSTSAAPIFIQRPAGIDQMDWLALQDTVSTCQACGLCGSRRNTVFGVGAPAQDAQAPQVDWLIVGEAPGENEDLQGEPFVGQAGKLLDNMLAAMKLSRRGERKAEGGGVYIANVLKCRPPGNRNPKPEEVAQCLPYLERQVALLKPQIILAMGRFAVHALLRDSVPDVESTPLGKLRGHVYKYHNLPVVVTYHPAYVLRNLPEKAKVWADLCLAMAHVRATAQSPD